jgi:glycosyltransferase involved in cell wall biosynthesis
VIDNGSEDRTAEIAAKSGADVVFEPQRGYGKAYKTGFLHATGDIIATSDADLTYPVEIIPDMIRVFEDDNLDFLFTDRYFFMKDGSMTRTHKIGNAILNGFLRLIYHVNIKDSQSGMWILRKRMLNRLILRSEGMSLSEEIKLEACYFNKCRWKEFPIEYRTRLGTVKLNTYRDGFNNLVFLLRKRLVR